MLDGRIDHLLAEQLMGVAHDPALRQLVYDRLGDYCHQCRNRLNSLKLSLFLGMKQSTESEVREWSKIERRYMELETIVDQVQTICRPMTLSRVSIPLDLLFEDRRDDWTRWMATGGSDLEFLGPRVRTPASFDVERMGQALDAVVRWRAGDLSPDRSARLRWSVEAGSVHVSWDETESAPDFDRERRADDESTWTLPLVARVVLAHGGTYQINETNGWRLDLSWPAAMVTN